MAGTSRRRFLGHLATAGIAGQALLRTGNVKAAVAEAKGIGAWPKMAYTTLGRTGFKGSRLVFGCGAALSNGQAVRLLEPALEAGINVFDVGYRRYYRDAERNMVPFLRRHRDQIYLISKANPGLEAGAKDDITVAQARSAAKSWLALMEESFSELQVDHIDAYYIMAANNPQLVASEELAKAFEQVKQAGRVKHIGLSTHENAEAVLKAAIASDQYDLAQIAITPAGWYDWQNRSMLEGTPPMTALRPLLDEARQAGIGLIGMKAGRFLAGRRWLGKSKPDAFDHLYGDQLKQANLSPFQRSYAYVLEHGLDAVNADMQNYLHLHENFVAAASSRQYVVG